VTIRVLAFDTATKTGVAFGGAGEKPRAWSVDLGKTDWPVRFSKTLRMVSHYVETLKPDLIAVEAFVGGPKANSNLVGLVACVQGEAVRLGVPVVSYYPATVRKHFLGGIRSKAPIKAQVYARCRMLGWSVEDLDAADAAALWDYTCSLQSRSHQIASIGGLFSENSQ
jgi:Holliday junction resolvasome RuvABC endonuclease subunit